MPLYVALLRGINVGRNKRVAMSELRTLIGGLGHTDVVTHLQSGNVVFRTTRRSKPLLAAEIERQITDRLGLEVKVIVITAEDLRRVVDANPLPDAAADPSRFLVTFLATAPPAAAVQALEAARFDHDEIRAGRQVVYMWHHQGISGSDVPVDFLVQHLGPGVYTARNWNTVTKLLDLAGG